MGQRLESNTVALFMLDGGAYTCVFLGLATVWSHRGMLRTTVIA